MLVCAGNEMLEGGHKSHRSTKVWRSRRRELDGCTHEYFNGSSSVFDSDVTDGVRVDCVTTEFDCAFDGVLVQGVRDVCFEDCSAKFFGADEVSVE